MRKKIVIMGRTFKVEETELFNDELGNCVVANGIIHVHDRQTDESKRATLLHEVIEVINNVCECGMEHRTICCLETGLAPFFNAKE